MSIVKVGLLQMIGCGYDKAASLAKGDDFCRRAQLMGADIALFPEMWSIGMKFFDPELPDDHQRWKAQAIAQEDSYIIHYRNLAEELDMAIALTYLEKWEDRPRNTVSLIDRHGKIVLTYAKVHTCEFSSECALTPGDDFPVCALDTAQGKVSVGFMICYDREFPESARILMLEGAELILIPNACEFEEHRRSQLKTRAFENMIGVALTNYAAPQNNGHSIAFDAVAYPEIEGNPRDTLIVEAGEGEDIYMAAFDMANIRDYRSRETWGNAYRRPRLYRKLISPEIDPPFVRPDATR